MPDIITSPPRIRLGLVGACKLGGAGAWLTQTLTQVWSVSQGLSPDKNCSSGTHIVRLTVGMADGADQIAVASFRDWRGQQADELLLVYPCSVAEFESSYGLVDIPAFQALRAQVPADTRTHELQLDGGMPSTAGAAGPLAVKEERIRAAACRYQSEVLIRQSEFLVAVLDRSEPEDPEGIRETVLRALALDTPVLVIDPVKALVFVLGHPEELRPDFVPASAHWEGEWWRAISPVLPPAKPAPVQGKIDGKEDQKTKGIESVYETPTATPVSTRWDKFQAPFADYAQTYLDQMRGYWTGQASNRLQVAAPVLADPSFWTVLRTLRTAVLGILSAPSAGQSARKLSTTIEAWRGQVADQQSAMMSEYRSLFLSNYWLGLGAVVLALTILIILALTGLKLSLPLLVLVVLLTFAKFWMVRQINRNTHRAEHLDASGVAVGLRYIAERLRAVPLLIALGSSRIDLVHQTPRRGRPHQIAEDLCRRLPLADCVHVHDSKVSLSGLSAFIKEQIGHHLKTHARMDAMRRMLERGVAISGTSVIVIVCVDLAVLGLKLLLKSPLCPCLLPATWVAPASSLLSYLGVFLVVLTALLPAMMATLNGILFQSQAEQLADRHGAMAEALAVLAEEATELQQRLASGAFETSGSHAVLSLTERSVRLMAEEVSEWATMYNQGVREA